MKDNTMKKSSVVILIGLMLGLTAIYPLNESSKTFVDAQSTAPLISMPVEYVNYTVSSVNGNLWAFVDGTYPIQIPQSSVGQELPMIYPMPTGVTNISIELNGQDVAFGNLTQADPDMFHYTYLGDWQMIFFNIQPATPNFVLTIHYQHPIIQANGTNMFLYNLNISGYLSNSSSESTAYFNVLFPTNCSGINVYTVPGQGAVPLTDTRTPVNFTISKGNGAQTVTFKIVSGYSDQPRDELVTFHEWQTQVPKFTSWTIEFSIIIVTVAVVVVVVAVLLFYFKKRKPGSLLRLNITGFELTNETAFSLVWSNP